MIPKKLYAIFIGCLLMAIACIDPFELTLEDGATQFLVVDGAFTPAKRSHILELYYTNSQIARRRRPVEGAMPYLVDENGQREAYKELGEGSYELKGTDIQGKVGATYFIEIDLVDGTKYRSRPAAIPQKIRGDSAYIKFGFKEELLITGAITRKPYLEVFVDSPLPNDGTDYWLKWDVATLYSFPELLCSPLGPPPDICFIPGNNDPQLVTILNGERFGSNRVEGVKVNEKRLMPNDFEFRGKHYFLVNQQSITKEAHDYWDKINRIANQTGSIFDAPPAGIQGNLYNVNDETEVVLGYFELTNIDSLRTFITAGSLSTEYTFPIRVCPGTFFFTREFFIECCNCERIEKASLVRPEWF